MTSIKIYKEKEKINIKFINSNWSTELFIILNIIKNKINIESIFIVWQEEINSITKSKIIENILLLNYIEFIKWTKFNNIIKSETIKSDETTFNNILGIEIRCKENTKKLNIKKNEIEEIINQKIKKYINL